MADDADTPRYRCQATGDSEGDRPAAVPGGRAVHARAAQLETREVPLRASDRAGEHLAGLQHAPPSASTADRRRPALPVRLRQARAWHHAVREARSEPGDYVRIKGKDEIVATLDKNNKNRGLLFDGEMSAYCGRTARRVAGQSPDRGIDGRDGRIKSDCIVLEGVVCAADTYRFCTRAIYSVLARDLAGEDRNPEDNIVTAPCIATAGAAYEHDRLVRAHPFVPEGFAQGFQALADDCEVKYEMTHEIVPEAARGPLDDPAFTIEWPDGGQRFISERDRAWPDDPSLAVLGRPREGV